MRPQPSYLPHSLFPLSSPAPKSFSVCCKKWGRSPKKWELNPSDKCCDRSLLYPYHGYLVPLSPRIMSWACLEIAALWERWKQFPPALALGPVSSFLSSKFLSPLPLVASLISLSLAFQPSIPPCRAWWFLILLCFSSAAISKGLLLAKGLCTVLSAVMMAFSITGRKDSLSVVAVLSVGYYAGANRGCFQSVLA